MIQDAGCNVACDYVQVDESTLPVIDNERHRAVKGYVWSVVNVMTGDRFFFYEHGSRSARVAMGLLKDFTGAIQSDGYIVYEHFEGMEGKKLLGCWAHARRKFFEAKVENEKLALEALSYIRRLYDVEAEADALDAADNKPDHERRKALRQERAYPEIKKFETWMEASILKCPPKSLMEEAISYTYKILKKLSLYVTDGRYKIDDNMVENSIRPLAVGQLSARISVQRFTHIILSIAHSRRSASRFSEWKRLNMVKAATKSAESSLMERGFGKNMSTPS